MSQNVVARMISEAVQAPTWRQRQTRQTRPGPLQFCQLIQRFLIVNGADGVGPGIWSVR